MELTLTGGTLSDTDAALQQTPVHSNATVKAINNTGGTTQTAAANQQGSHLSHSHNHSHGGHCCNSSHAPARPVVDASTLLPTNEVAQRFRTDKKFRLNVLSNVVRGGPYNLFINLVTVLVLDGEDKKGDETADEGRDEAVLKEADPQSLAQLLDGYGADGHTLAHWCAKRGEYVVCSNTWEVVFASLIMIIHPLSFYQRVSAR